jgi:hypothetical protein
MDEIAVSLTQPLIWRLTKIQLVLQLALKLVSKLVFQLQIHWLPLHVRPSGIQQSIRHIGAIPCGT